MQKIALIPLLIGIISHSHSGSVMKGYLPIDSFIVVGSAEVAGNYSAQFELVSQH